jgi:hypothetical protein
MICQKSKIFFINFHHLEAFDSDGEECEPGNYCLCRSIIEVAKRRFTYQGDDEAWDQLFSLSARVYPTEIALPLNLQYT